MSRWYLPSYFKKTKWYFTTPFSPLSRRRRERGFSPVVTEIVFDHRYNRTKSTYDKRRGSQSSLAAVWDACWPPGICRWCCGVLAAAAAPSICWRRYSGRTPRVCRPPPCRSPASSPPAWVSLRVGYARAKARGKHGNYTRLINSPPRLRRRSVSRDSRQITGAIITLNTGCLRSGAPA